MKNIDKNTELPQSCKTAVSGSALLNEILNEQQEIISSPIRFNGVHIEKIKAVFKKYGIDYDVGF